MKPLLTALALIAFATFALAGEQIGPIQLWPNGAPDEKGDIGEEGARPPRPDAKKKIIIWQNVSAPTLTVYKPEKARDTGAAVVVCPGGAYNILALDLEGTEVCEWLNSIGVTAVLLKYRVPARNPKANRWIEAVQDAQRAVSLVRGRAKELGVRPDRIGIMGFSAGGATAALCALLEQRQYPATDEFDKIPFRPDFAGLIYPGALVPRGEFTLADYVKVTGNEPPFFFVHAHDDRVSSLNSALLYAELKKRNVPAELHIYASGGHGYGLRKTHEPITNWPDRMTAWLRSRKLLL